MTTVFTDWKSSTASGNIYYGFSEPKKYKNVKKPKAPKKPKVEKEKPLFFDLKDLVL